MGYRIAVVGATGNVGRQILQTLSARRFPADHVAAVASRSSAGSQVSFGDDITLDVEALDDFNFKGFDLVLSSPGARVSGVFAPKAAACGAVVIDNTSRFRMDKDVPLIVPEVNGRDIANYTSRGIIANPNCSTIQMVVALKPLHDLARIRRVVVATYQSVSGAGKDAMDELFDQTRAIYMNGTPSRKAFSKQIAFNVIPQIDVFMDDGTTKEEWKMTVETKKILDRDIDVCATCVRVPVFIGHAEAVHIECDAPIDVDDARKALAKAPGVTVIDRHDDDGFVTPAEIAGDGQVYVSRIRKDSSVENGLAMWVVSDNLLKGAALNTVQIAEVLVEKYL